MSEYKVLSEDEQCFRVQHPDGKAFVVPKKGLGQANLDRIRGFSRGGEVLHASTGLEVPEPAAVPWEKSGGWDAFKKDFFPADPEMEAKAAAFKAAGGESGWNRPAPLGGAAAALPLKGTNGLPYEQTQPGPVAAPTMVLPPLEVKGRMPAAAPVKPAGAAAPPAAPRAPGAPSEFEKGEADQLAGIKAQGEAANKEAAAQTGIFDKLAKDRETMTASYHQRIEANQQKSDALFQGVLDSKVDPHRFWNSKTTGQRVSAAIGMLLGGLGAGLTHGPNLALEQINKSIDRDIDAQKSEIGKKEGLLTHYLQQGRDLQTAQQLAAADLRDISAAQLQKVAAQFGGEKALAAAQQAGGQLRVQATSLRQEAESRGLDNQMKRHTMALQDFEMGQRQRTMAAIQRLSAGNGQAGDEVFLPPEMRERLVRGGPGGARLALTKEDAQKAKEVMGATDELKSVLGETTTARKNMPWYARALPASMTKEGAAAETLKGRVVNAISEANGIKLTGLSGPEQELFRHMAPDPTTVSEDAFKGRLQQLYQLIVDKRTSTSKTRF